MSVINLAPRKIYYEKYPATKPKGTIIFIHGSGGTSQVWREQVKELSRFWDCISIDLPDHGESSGPVCASVGEAASLLRTFITEQCLLKPLCIVGHSLGAAIALHYARYFADDLKAFILIGGGAKLKVLPQVLEGLARGEMNEAFARMTFSPLSDPTLIEAEVITYMQNSPAVLYADLSACNEFNFTDQLAAITLPGLIIVGKEDVLTPVKYAEYLKTHLAGASLEVIETAGHFTMLEDPAAVNTAIIEFINKIGT
ncbi:MAG: alpha/beta hydrolase [Syntrophomonadaceae bacterium]|jgi:pimeloyl-ACP methyl ester carboxylesterase|nr:alpha/beta hydrolase [Syntrophomonadaceae bacterium]